MLLAANAGVVDCPSVAAATAAAPAINACRRVMKALISFLSSIGRVEEAVFIPNLKHRGAFRRLEPHPSAQQQREGLRLGLWSAVPAWPGPLERDVRDSSSRLGSAAFLREARLLQVACGSYHSFSDKRDRTGHWLGFEQLRWLGLLMKLAAAAAASSNHLVTASCR